MFIIGVLSSSQYNVINRTNLQYCGYTYVNKQIPYTATMADTVCNLQDYAPTFDLLNLKYNRDLHLLLGT